MTASIPERVAVAFLGERSLWTRDILAGRYKAVRTNMGLVTKRVDLGPDQEEAEAQYRRVVALACGREAVRAMREPTKEMLVTTAAIVECGMAEGGCLGIAPSSDNCREIWRDMIDEALKPQNDEPSQNPQLS